MCSVPIQVCTTKTRRRTKSEVGKGLPAGTVPAMEWLRTREPVQGRSK
jgi:hypothetical protein